MKKLLFALLALVGLFAAPVHAQQIQALVVSSCGSVSYTAATYGYATMDTTGKLCDSGSGGGGTVTANQGTAGASPWPVSLSASASGGATPYHIASAASNNSTNVKSTPGTVYDVTLINTTTTLGDFRFYDSASAPTCSSATGVVNNLPVQSNAISPGIHLNYPGGKLFTNGISFCYTGAVADNDNTNAAIGVQINIDYK